MILVGRTGFISLDCLPLKRFSLCSAGTCRSLGRNKLYCRYTDSCFKHTLWYEGSPRNGPLWKLIIDLLDTHHELPALFKITINGKSWKYALPKGSGKSIDGDYSQIKPHTIEIPLNSGVIRKGSNSIALTSLEGSWILFDDIRLMGPDNAELNEVNKSVYLRDVKAADFQTTSPVAQPLLVDIEHLSGHPLLEVKVDGKRYWNNVWKKEDTY